MTAAGYPLTWPETMPRQKSREAGKFRTSLSAALKNVEASLRAFGRDSGKNVTSIVLSSNFTLGVSKPADPGVAVWFTWDGLQVCIPVDRYSTIEANLQAIHHIIEARRVELRHGTLALVRATFTGFAALPAPNAKRPWQEVFGVKGRVIPGQSLKDFIEREYRTLAKERHPDRPYGSDEAMAELNQARADALKEIGA